MSKGTKENFTNQYLSRNITWIQDVKSTADSHARSISEWSIALFLAMLCDKHTLWHYILVIMCINLGTTLSWTSYSVAKRDWCTFCSCIDSDSFLLLPKGKTVHSRTLTDYNIFCHVHTYDKCALKAVRWVCFSCFIRHVKNMGWTKVLRSIWAVQISGSFPFRAPLRRVKTDDCIFSV